MSNANDNLAMRRIAGLVDENSFMEIGSLVTARNTDFGLSDTDTPSDGVVVGHGLIDGSLVFVYSQDPGVLGGTIGEMHAKKIAAAYDMAVRMGAPIIGLIDCAGMRLQESVDALEAVGTLYARQAAASGVVPQITAVFGTCGGGMAIIPALSDFAFAEEEHARIFVNSPNAIPGNTTKKCDTSSAKFQSEEAGTLDGVGSEEEILAQIRSLVSILPGNNAQAGAVDLCADDLNRACSHLDTMKGDPRFVLSEISDGHLFIETKGGYAKEMVTGFIKLNGITVGAVANATELYDNGEKVEEFDAALSANGCGKAANFIAFCDAFEIPVVSFTNAEGFLASCECSERRLPKALARLTFAFANATVPKVNVIAGKAYGSAYAVMNSKSLGADIVYAWPDAKVGMMDAKLAAKIMYADASADVIDEKAREYDALQGDVKTAARRGYVDRIIDYADTRKYLIAAFEMLYTKNADLPYKKHGAK